MSSGFVYVLSNKAMPGLLKIGHTTRNSGIRKEELYTTGVPIKFEVEISLGLTNFLNVSSPKSILNSFGSVINS